MLVTRGGYETMCLVVETLLFKDTTDTTLTCVVLWQTRLILHSASLQVCTPVDHIA